MRMQHVIHTAVQENNLEARLYAWEYFISFYFMFNKTSYVRYESYYLETLKTIENRYPGMKEMMKHAGLSAQGQEKYPLQTSIDQRGEQTMNRDAKITGGIKAFTTEEDSILKWSLTRSDQACNTRELQNLCGLSTDPGIYKPFRPSQILTTEKLVQEVIQIFREDYKNPFDIRIVKNTLVNISSGKPLKEEPTAFLLSCPTVGKEKYKDFVDTRLRKKEISVHDPIKQTKTKLLTFKSSSSSSSSSKKKK